eukprot:CAMPEP_0179193864 /NCGR_PEP_ID=MMETSP0796-20121207/96345_1 /TAXON_ID=73915 /ORGANISM="Pyrodinium bahamense, Strain pbaha01" /LENGTH=58 /DNA_ID=CAMNT_0020898179 /DNA_START=32 /DNA_END=204 /DNA_ORIENTATION=+
MQCLQDCRAQETRLHELLQERLALADVLRKSNPTPWQKDTSQAKVRLQAQIDRMAATA